MTFIRTENLRYRVCPDLDCVIVFTPRQRRLCWLNVAAWKLVCLCTGEPVERMYEDYIDALTGVRRPPSPEERDRLRSSLLALEVNGVVYARRPTNSQAKEHHEQESRR